MFTEEDPSKSYVWVIGEGSKLERRLVERGGLSEFGVLIKGGLKAGEQIVTAGVGVLNEGQEVAPLEKKDSGS